MDPQVDERERERQWLRTVPDRQVLESLTIEDEKNRKHKLSPLWFEQEQWANNLHTFNRNLAVKPRQVGFTTITMGRLFTKGVRSRFARRQLSMVHEEGARVRLAKMIRTYHDNMPFAIQPGYAVDNISRTEFRKWRDRQGEECGGYEHHRLLAGGRGQGRSWTFNDVHATEMAHWPSGTASTESNGDESADEAAFSSAMATVHDEGGLVVVESTGNGPRGLFHKLWQIARKDPSWGYTFVPWNIVPRYKRALTPTEARDIEQELTAQERVLIAKFGLSLEQVAWRRDKFSLGATELTFRRQFPLTDSDPFMVDAHGWFNADKLNVMLGFVPTLGNDKTAYREFHAPEDDRQYVFGVDTAGGVGRDEASIQVLRDDQLHVATWNSDRASPEETAVMVGKIGNRFTVNGRKPYAVIEANKYGEEVIKLVAQMKAVVLYKNEFNEDFWSTGGRAGASKRRAFVHARTHIENDWTVINDAETIRQGQAIEEQSDGNIEASSGHDDRMFAYVLGLWGCKKFWRGDPSSIQEEAEKSRSVRDRFRDGRIG